MKLYHHQTDGGAEYLCTQAIEGTDEGDIRTAIVRLDGEPELTKPVYSAAPELADMLEEICDAISFSPVLYNLIGHERYHRARAILKKASS